MSDLWTPFLVALVAVSPLVWLHPPWPEGTPPFAHTPAEVPLEFDLPVKDPLVAAMEGLDV